MIEYPILIGTIVLLSITIIAKLTVRDFKINKHYDTYGQVILWIYPILFSPRSYIINY